MLLARFVPLRWLVPVGLGLLLMCLSGWHSGAVAAGGAVLCTNTSTSVLVDAWGGPTPLPDRGDWEIVAVGLGVRSKQVPVWSSTSLSQCATTTGTPAPSNAFGSAGGLSGDGGTMTCSLDAGPGTPLHACTISSTQGVTDLGALDPAQAGTLGSVGFGANTDGSVVVGAADTDASGNQHAFRWTRDAGMVDLGAANGASGMSRAFAVSGDGSVVVGESAFPSGQRRAFIWTEATGFQDVDPAGFGSATAISADGRVIVGSNQTRAFRWTAETGALQLPLLPERTTSVATGVSDNGKVVVGMAAQRPLSFRNSTGWDFDVSDTRAFRWTAEGGMADLAQLLAERGVDMTGITLVAALGVSPDGRFIAGALTRADAEPNQTFGFVAQVCDDAVDACAGSPPN